MPVLLKIAIGVLLFLINLRGQIMLTIKLNTRFGEIEVDSSRIITFPNGLPGFANNKRWTLFHEVDDKGEMVSGVVIHLQSLDDEKVTLPLTYPNLFGFNFELVLTDDEVTTLKMEDPNDILVLATLSINGEAQLGGKAIPPENMFANISAPILINTKSMIGIQKILAGKQSKVNFSATVVL